MRTILKQNSGRSGGGGGASFLPADYVEKKRERRANLLCLTLFLIVIFGVVAAFFVTNRQWETVRDQQQTINVRYAQAAKDIEQLKQLETQKAEMLGKAELTAALVEKAPRSRVMAEIINRLPDKAALLELELSSERPRARRVAPPKPQQPQSLTSQSDGGHSAAPKIEVPRMTVRLSIVGVASTHNDVATFVTRLQQCELLDRVDLKYSEATTIDDRELNKFLIETRLRPDADAREIEGPQGLRAGAFLDNSDSDSDAEEIEPARVEVPEEKEN